MKIGTQQILKVLYLLSWILFIGLCIEAGAHIVNAFSVFLSPAIAEHLWHEVDLSALYKYGHGHFFAEAVMISIVAVLKAILFYLIVKVLHEKKLNMDQPFNREMGRFIFKMFYVALLIGLFSWWGFKYAEWLVKQGVSMPDIQSLRLDGANVWLFMSVTLFVIAQIFKRGIEIQQENELTV